MLTCLLAPLSVIGSDDDAPLNIQVRSEVDRPFKGWGREKAKDHGKVYVLASLQEATGPVPLVRPVDEKALLEKLRARLTRSGFVEATEDQVPDIVLTVIYGRGYLHNPYLDKHTMPAGMSDPPVVIIKGTDIQQMIREREPGYEGKLQDAQHEKLFIIISAWAFPDSLPPPKAGKKNKPKLYWRTTMVTDDPINRDLGQFVDKLLAAGSDFFDRETKDEEAFIRTDLPEGFIKYGDLKVMPDDDKDEKPPQRK